MDLIFRSVPAADAVTYLVENGWIIDSLNHFHDAVSIVVRRIPQRTQSQDFITVQCALKQVIGITGIRRRDLRGQGV